MSTPGARLLAGSILAVLSAAGSIGAQGVDDVPTAWGHRFSERDDHVRRSFRPSHGTSRLRHWNEIAVDASGLDHTPVAPGEPRVFGEALGPGRTSRALAIVHIAVFEAMNAIAGGYESYLGLPPAPPGASMDGAIATAAHDTLCGIFPSQMPAFDELLEEDLRQIRDHTAMRRGQHVGRLAAAAILHRRSTDGAQHVEPRVGVDFITGDAPGIWRQDPISQIPLALGAFWGSVTPFVLRSGDQFRAPPPPALESHEYTAAFREVKRVGGDGVITPTRRTPEQTFVGIYWGYDGTPGLGTPPRLYNQIAVAIADRMGTTGMELARLLALVNVAMADAGIGIWESKYVYQYWRPVTGIREADPGTGPTSAGDGNQRTRGDPTFSPLGAQASNLQGPDFTPPFPAYPSGHAGFGGALFETLRLFYGTDRIPFTFVSEELNGMTRDNDGLIRPLIPRHFRSLSEAEEENGQSRIYLGIHWAFDKTEGIVQGRRVAKYVFHHAFKRRGQRR